MSAGAFEAAKYEQTTAGNVWPCRAQPETKQLSLNSVANAYPAAGATAGLPRLRLRQGKRRFGLSIRTVTIRLTANGTAGTIEYLAGRLQVVPVFTAAVHVGYSIGQVGTYLGIACVCVGKFPQV